MKMLLKIFGVFMLHFYTFLAQLDICLHDVIPWYQSWPTSLVFFIFDHEPNVEVMACDIMQNLKLK